MITGISIVPASPAGRQLDSKLAGTVADDHRGSTSFQPHRRVGSWTANLQEQQQMVTMIQEPFLR
jgi:hypothetical protein